MAKTHLDSPTPVSRWIPEYPLHSISEEDEKSIRQKKNKKTARNFSTHRPIAA